MWADAYSTRSSGPCTGGQLAVWVQVTSGFTGLGVLMMSNLAVSMNQFVMIELLEFNSSAVLHICCKAFSKQTSK